MSLCLTIQYTVQSTNEQCSGLAEVSYSTLRRPLPGTQVLYLLSGQTTERTIL
jgi:hypothetical protein